MQQIDQRFVQNIQNENMLLRQQINRLSGTMKTLDQKYQKSLKQMSSIMNANQNLKSQLDNIKIGVRDQIDNNAKEVRTNYQRRIQQLIKQKNDIFIMNQNLLREKEQLQMDFHNIEQSLWEMEALKNQIASVKKQNEKLILQAHTLTQNQQNPEHKATQLKLTEKIQQLNMKIIELNTQNTQSKKQSQALQTQKQNLQKQISNLNKKIEQLQTEINNAEVKINKSQNMQVQQKNIQIKKNQIQIMDLRRQNAELTGQIERLKLQKVEMTSQINKNQAQLNLLSTLKSLHGQLEPLRFQVQQLKRDKYYERQNTNKEKSEMQMKILSSEHQLQTLRQLIKDLENKNKDLSQQIRQKNWQRHKFQELQQQKRILEGRIIVYEAMQLVGRNRDKPHHIERIQQFERRIQLLLQQQNLKYLVNNANVHQLIAMKAYVIQLDNKLQILLQQNQNLVKKYSQYKDRYKQLASENKQILSKHYSTVNAYKGKIAGYEKLVIKLTQQLEKFLKDSQNLSIQSHYKSIITLYESKILSIHNESNAKKQQLRDLLKKFQNLQLEHKTKLSIMRELQLEISHLKSQNKQLNTKLSSKQLQQQTRHASPIHNISQDHYKGIITQKTKQILQLQQNLSKLRLKLDKSQFEHDREIQNYKSRMSRFQIQIQNLRLENSEFLKQLSTAKHSQQFGQLVSKMTLLERNLAAMSKSQVNLFKQQQSQSRESLNLQYERQIQLLKQQNEYLAKQLQAMRSQQKRTIAGQNITITKTQINYQQEIQRIKDNANRNTLQLRNRILQLEAQLKIKDKQFQLKQKQLINSSLDQSQVVVQYPVSQTQGQNQINYLQEQNAHLRIQIERIKASYRPMTIQSEGLMSRIRELQAYISTLKQQFDQVANKMSEYQRQLGAKDNMIHELKLKIKNIQQQSYIQSLNNSQQSSNLFNEQQKKLRDIEIEIERSKRQIQSKYRDLERLQLQLNRRESQIEMKSRDLKDRLRKVEERQRIVSDQQNRLIRLSSQLESKSNQLKNYKPQEQTPTFNRYSNQELQQLRRQVQQLNRKIKRLQGMLSEKDNIINSKDESIDKLIRQKSQLIKQLDNIKPDYQDKLRMLQSYEKQIGFHKEQYLRLEQQMEKLWKEYDNIKHQLRNKQRQLNDFQFQRQQLKNKYEAQIRRLNQKLEIQITNNQNSLQIYQSNTSSPDRKYNQKQIQTYKQQNSRLENQIQKLIKQLQGIRLQLRNKQRRENDFVFERDQIKRNYQKQIRKLNQQITQLQSRMRQLSIQQKSTTMGYTQNIATIPTQNFNQNQLQFLKKQNQRLQRENQKIFKQLDQLKVKLRGKELDLSNAEIDRDEIKKKSQIRIRNIEERLRESQRERESLSHQSSPIKQIDFKQIQRQFQQKLRQIQQKYKLKIKQIYKENQQNTTQLQQNISDLTDELRRLKMQNEPDYKKQMQSQIAAIKSLQTHFATLENQIKAKESFIAQLQNNLAYYKNTLSQRQSELQKLYELSNIPSSVHADQNQGIQIVRLQNQIVNLQNLLKKLNEQKNNHEECIHKQHLLRMEIQRLSGMLQAKIAKSQHNSEIQAPPSPHSQYLDNSYLIELQQTNRKLQQDLTRSRQKLLSQFDRKGQIQDYLAILVITFAEVDALRQRIYQLEQNFKEQHQRQLNVIKKIDDLKQHEVDVQKIFDLLKQLEIAHRAFHQEEQRSKQTFIKKINTQVLVLPGSQSISIADQLNRSTYQNQMIHNIPQQSMFLYQNQYKSIDSSGILNNNFGQTSIKNDLKMTTLNTNLYPGIQNQSNILIMPSSLNNSITSSFQNQSNFGVPLPNYNFSSAGQSSQFGIGNNFGISSGNESFKYTGVNFTGGLSSYNPIGGSLGQTQMGGGLTGIGASLSSDPSSSNLRVNFNNTGQFSNMGTTAIGSGPSIMGGGSRIIGGSSSKSNFRYGIFDQGQSGANLTSTYQSPAISRPGSFSITPQQIPLSRGSSPMKNEIISPNLQGQFAQPYQHYQPEGIQIGGRIPSERNILPLSNQSSIVNLNYSGSETNINPYMVNNSQLRR